MLRSPQYWQRLIAYGVSRRPQPRIAQYVSAILPETDSRPFFVICDDGHAYVIKMIQTDKPHMPRVLVNEHIVGYVGRQIGAPVPDCATVNVSSDLLRNTPGLGTRPYVGGIAHGSLQIPGLGDAREQLEQYDTDINKSRFLALSILYGLVYASDHQVQYERAEPHRVFSVDHGHFFPNGPRWEIQHLTGAEPAVLDGRIMAAHNFDDDLRRAAAPSLMRLRNTRIALAVALPPDDWSLSMEERCTVAEYLAVRRDQLVAQLQK